MVGPRRSQRPAECRTEVLLDAGDAGRRQLTHQRHDSGQLVLGGHRAGMSGGGRGRHPRRRGLAIRAASSANRTKALAASSSRSSADSPSSSSPSLLAAALPS